VKCVCGYPKSVLDAGFESSSFLAYTFTWFDTYRLFSFIFFVEYIKAKSLPVVDRNSGFEFNDSSIEAENTLGMFERLRVSFLHRSELCVRGHGGHLETPWKEVKMQSLLITLLFSSSLHTSCYESVSCVTMEFEIRTVLNL
jgi:hypothetical protein